MAGRKGSGFGGKSLVEVLLCLSVREIRSSVTLTEPGAAREWWRFADRGAAVNPGRPAPSVNC